MRLLSALLATIPLVSSIFLDEASQIDYHHALVGFPQKHTTFFHAPQRDSRATLIYTLSEHSILAAVNPKDGSLVWRQRLPQPRSNATNSFLVTNHQNEAVVSSVEDQIASWSAIDGKLIWARQKQLPGKVVALRSLEALGEGESSSTNDLAAAFHGDTTTIIQRIDSLTGETKWEYDDSSSDTPIALSQNPTTLYYVSLTSSIIGTPKIKVTSVDPADGKKLDQTTLNAEGDVSTVDSIIHVDSASQAPIVVWTDKSKKSLKINILGTKSILTVPITNNNGEAIEAITIHAADGITAPTHFLALYTSEDSHWGEVFHLDAIKQTIKKEYDVVRLVGKGTIATSVSNNEIFFTRAAKGAFLVLSSAKNEIVDRYNLPGFGVDNLIDHPHPVTAIGEVQRKSASGGLSTRAAVLLSSGDWILILNGKTSWQRPEELSYITSAQFAELPRIKQSFAAQLETESHQSLVAAYIHRVKRHIEDLQRVPAYAESVVKRILITVQGKDSETAEAQSDTFGFHQHVIVATEHGRVLALDTSNSGSIVWSTAIPEFESGQTAKIIPSKGVVRIKTKTANAVLDVLTGKYLRKGQDSKKPKPLPKRITVEFVAQPDRVVGVTGHPVNVLWTFSPAPGLEISSVEARPEVDPVAAIGDVLGDRKVLYKYLNPNTAVITCTNSTTNIASFTLIDTVSGNVLYSIVHKNVDTTRHMPVMLSENWFAYSFSTTGAAGLDARGTVLVFAKLYESSIPDDRGALGAATNFSALVPPASGSALLPYVRAQAFLIPEEISDLSVSRTRQGITSRLLVAVLPDSGAVAGIPLPVLDPRRPVNRDPTKLENEEGLFRYMANLEFDPKWILTHSRHVDGLTDVAAAPALVESTSLLFMYGNGGDVYGTRAIPSGNFDVLGKEFNRIQMVATVIALFFATLLAAPVVRRKTINMLWEI